MVTINENIAKKVEKFENKMKEIYEKWKILNSMNENFDFDEFFINEIEPMIMNIYVVYRYPYNNRSEDLEKYIIEFRDGISIEWYSENEVYIVVSDGRFSYSYIPSRIVYELLKEIALYLGFEL